MGRRLPRVRLGSPPREWKIRVGPRPRGVDRAWVGYCDHETRTIWVSNQQGDLATLETAVHEAMHAVLPDLSETAITRMSRQVLAVALVVVGRAKAFRRDD